MFFKSQTVITTEFFGLYSGNSLPRLHMYLNIYFSMFCMQREPNPGAYRYRRKSSELELIQIGHVRADCGRDLYCHHAFPTIYLFMKHEYFHLVDSFVLVIHGQKQLPCWCRSTLLTYWQSAHFRTVQTYTNRHVRFPPGKVLLPCGWLYISEREKWDNPSTVACGNKAQKFNLLGIICTSCQKLMPV